MHSPSHKSNSLAEAKSPHIVVHQNATLNKLQAGKLAMAERCQKIGRQILDEAGVRRVDYLDRLKGRAYIEPRYVQVPKPTTRRRLYILAHEAGHIELCHGRKAVHREEFEAEQYAHRVLRKHGIAVPKKSTTKAKKYVAWKIHQALRRGARTIDREAYKWARDYMIDEDQDAMKTVQLADLS